MSNNNKTKQGSGLIHPDTKVDKKKVKKISTISDGLMEREDDKVLTEDGRELLKEN